MRDVFFVSMVMISIPWCKKKRIFFAEIGKDCTFASETDWDMV